MCFVSAASHPHTHTHINTWLTLNNNTSGTYFECLRKYIAQKRRCYFHFHCFASSSSHQCFVGNECCCLDALHLWNWKTNEFRPDVFAISHTPSTSIRFLFASACLPIYWRSISAPEPILFHCCSLSSHEVVTSSIHCGHKQLRINLHSTAINWIRWKVIQLMGLCTDHTVCTFVYQSGSIDECKRHRSNWMLALNRLSSWKWNDTISIYPDSLIIHKLPTK